MRKGDQWIQVAANAGGDNDSITFYTFKAVAVSAMKQEMEATAGSIASALETSGRMALYGIDFATNSAAVTPESDKTLTEIATLLKDRPEWKITVEGHTDNVGDTKPVQDNANEEGRAKNRRVELVKR